MSRRPVHLSGPAAAQVFDGNDDTDITELSVQNCAVLLVVPRTIARFDWLRRLTLRNCQALTELDPCVGQLRCLTRITVENCPRLETLPFLGSTVKHVAVRKCPLLAALPDSMGGMVALNILVLSGCPLLQTMPASLWRLPRMRHVKLLCLDGLLTLGVRRARHVLELEIDHCGVLAELPALPNVRELYIFNCRNVQILPCGLQHLAGLRVRECTGLRELPVACLDVPATASIVVDWGGRAWTNHAEICRHIMHTSSTLRLQLLMIAAWRSGFHSMPADVARLLTDNPFDYST